MVDMEEVDSLVEVIVDEADVTVENWVTTDAVSLRDVLVTPMSTTLVDDAVVAGKSQYDYSCASKADQNTCGIRHD